MLPAGYTYPKGAEIVFSPAPLFAPPLSRRRLEPHIEWLSDVFYKLKHVHWVKFPLAI